jgi:hypothetical protein
MGPWAAFREGLRRVARAPALLAGTFAVTLLIAIPLTIALRGMLASQLAASAMSAARSVNREWWQEFLSQATGLGQTFVPTTIGFSAVLKNLSDLADNLPLATTIAGAVGAWLVVWSFLSGGIIDRLARDRWTRSEGFFGAAGTHFPAILRLGLLAVIVYGALFRWLHPLLFDRGYERLTADMSVERSAFLVRLVLYAVFGTLVAAANLIIDYARIRIVVEDRRSAIGSLVASLRFVRRHAAAVAGLYLLNTLLFVVLIAIYAIVSSGAAPGAAVSYALIVGELYVLARHYLKLSFYASQTALFQARLAHAGYTASPPVVWPESPAAESIGNAASHRP